MTSRKAGWLAAIGFWTLFGLISGIQVWISMLDHGHSVPRLVGYYILVWEGWVGVTAVVVLLVRRWPIIPISSRALLVHLTAACGVALIHLSYWLVLLLMTRPFDQRTATWAGVNLLQVLYSRFPLEFVLYCAVAGSAQAVDYYAKYRERAMQTAQLEASLSAARLHALELQIQPHFLFNTLNTVSSLVRTGKHDEAVVMIAGLSDLLRYTLDHAGDQSVTLDEESGMVRRYLEIQRVRFVDRLTFGIDIAPDVRRAAVPALILQPLAENAIRHGIARRAEAGVVNVRAFRENGRLCIEMFNSGTLSPSTEGGIGLRNTRERLQQLYGEGQRFELRSTGDGVLAALSIPCREMT